MTVNDPIADMLTRMRNAQMASKSYVSVPHSKMKEALAEVLKKNKFIADYQVSTAGKFKDIDITFDESRPNLELKRVSKPGQRIYVSKTDIPRVKNGMGIAVVSTSKGLMTGLKARKSELGGELLCTVS